MRLVSKLTQHKKLQLLPLGLIFCLLAYSQMVYSQTTSEKTSVNAPTNVQPNPSVNAPASAPINPTTNTQANPDTNFSTYPDISGIYICYGNDFSDKSEYTAEITATQDGEIIHYEGAEQGIDISVNTYEGTSIFAKGSKDTFASVFWQKNNHNKGGVVIYKVLPNGDWSGIWKWSDKPDINVEQCRKKESRI